ncbi:MAG: hypothetical protein ABIT76_08085 [Chthoniobacterales bacterium]
MRTRYHINDPERAHFITGTIVNWLPVFATSACADILVSSLVHCREQRGLKIYAWVVLDTHFHAILGGPELERTITAIKRHTSLVLLEQVKLEGREWLMNQLVPKLQFGNEGVSSIDSLETRKRVLPKNRP